MPKKKCRSCKTEFDQFNTLQNLCFKCLASKAKTTREKDERKAHRKAKESLKTARDHVPAAQKAFNKLIRLRDYDQPCISCGRTESEIEEKFMAGKWDCGHFKTRGAFPELKFVLYNAHKQCKSCNGGSGKYTRKIENVEWLEGPHAPKKYTIDELKEIKTGFNAWARELEKAIE